MSVPDHELDDDSGLAAHCPEHGDYYDMGKGCRQCAVDVEDLYAEERMERRRR